MAMITAVEERTPPPLPSAWATVLVVVCNFLLGVPGIVPAMATAIYLQNGPLADLGITYSTMDDLDGMWIFFVPVIVVCFLVWLGLGLLLRYFFRRPGGRWFWPISAAAVAAPFVILLITTNVMARLT